VRRFAEAGGERYSDPADFAGFVRVFFTLSTAFGGAARLPSRFRMGR